MIRNDKELEGTQERIAYFYRLLAQFRVTVPPDIYPSMAGGYLAEIEKMHAEVIEYLKRHSTEPAPAEAA
ncbi:MAG TPA: hypothetical protein VNO70_26445 [Blastocatellia bacterium]|nr:hypothetical protein [Blastocatellia bacterium]